MVVQQAQKFADNIIQITGGWIEEKQVSAPRHAGRLNCSQLQNPRFSELRISRPSSRCTRCVPWAEACCP